METQMKDDERGMIALEATWDIDALLVLMITALEGDDSSVVWATRKMLQQVKKLYTTVMDAIGDEMVDNESLRKRA